MAVEKFDAQKEASEIEELARRSLVGDSRANEALSDKLHEEAINSNNFDALLKVLSRNNWPINSEFPIFRVQDEGKPVIVFESSPAQTDERWDRVSFQMGESKSTNKILERYIDSENAGSADAYRAKVVDHQTATSARESAKVDSWNSLIENSGTQRVDRDVLRLIALADKDAASFEANLDERERALLSRMRQTLIGSHGPELSKAFSAVAADARAEQLMQIFAKELNRYDISLNFDLTPGHQFMMLGWDGGERRLKVEPDKTSSEAHDGERWIQMNDQNAVLPSSIVSYYVDDRGFRTSPYSDQESDQFMLDLQTGKQVFDPDRLEVAFAKAFGRGDSKVSRSELDVLKADRPRTFDFISRNFDALNELDGDRNAKGITTNDMAMFELLVDPTDRDDARRMAIEFARRRAADRAETPAVLAGGLIGMGIGVGTLLLAARTRIPMPVAGIAAVAGAWFGMTRGSQFLFGSYVQMAERDASDRFQSQVDRVAQILASGEVHQPDRVPVKRD